MKVQGKTWSRIYIVLLPVLLLCFLGVWSAFNHVLKVAVEDHIREAIVHSSSFFHTLRYGMDTTMCFDQELRKIFPLYRESNAFACFRVNAEIVGGFDFSRIEIESNVSTWKNLLDPFYQKEITVRIPPPEVVSVNGISYEMLYAKNWKEFPFLERARFLQIVEKRLREKAVEMGLLKDTAEYFAAFITELGAVYGVRVKVAVQEGSSSP